MLAAGELSWAGIILNCAALLVLVALSGVFSGSETVLFSLSRSQLEQAAGSSNPFRRMAAWLMRRPKQTLMTVLVANTAVNVLVFAVSYVFFDRLAQRAGTWLTPVAGVASVLLVVVGGEVVPKVIGVSMAGRLAPVCAAIVRTAGVVAGPIGRVIDIIIAEPFVRLMLGVRRPTGDADLSREELKTLLDMSRRGGTIRPLEDTFLREIIDLEHVRVRDVMVPRVEMTAWDINEPVEELRALMRRTRYRKVPVYDGSPDRIVGLVYAKVLFLSPDTPLSELVVPVAFVPELATCEHLLHHFRQTRTQIAMVIDEFGGVAGLVTLEDVLEEIVGELHDPDDEAPEPEIQALPDGGYDVSGQLSVRYWAEALHLDALPEKVATVGGLVTARLGRPAHVGDRVGFGNVALEVTAVRGRRVERVRLHLSGGADEEGTA